MSCQPTICAILVMATLVIGNPLILSSHVTSPSSRAQLADYALPGADKIEPIHYDLELIPYMNDTGSKKQFTFDGVVTILIHIKAATKEIRMHAYDMTITEKPTLTKFEVPPIVITAKDFSMSNVNDDKHFLNIIFQDDVKPDEYMLEIKFVGKINDQLEGFYRSTYIDATGTQKWLAITQFQSTGARRAFPCWDEPKFKATFGVKIAYAPEYKVISNMPLVKDTVDVPGLTGWKWAEFQESPIMSTYLVAFSVNQFNKIMHPRIPKYAIYARPEAAASQSIIANELAPLVDDYMKWYVSMSNGILPKTDQIAVPDFSAGAMENWGMITYRETRLLFEEGVSTSWDRQLVKLVVTHELAHQWFGNLVSPAWWDVIWLNEGFATYFEYHALNKIESTWQLINHFVLEEMHPVFQHDALTTAHALLVPNVVTPAETLSVFNSIAYSKGACILRMLEQWIGEKNFRDSLRNYLSAFEFKVVTMNDLWDKISQVLTTNNANNLLPSSVTLQTVMDNWTKKPGYPVINVTRSGTLIQLGQERYLSKTDRKLASSTKWYIPVTYTTENSPNFSDRKITWLYDSVINITVTALNTTQWVILNLQQVGFYRVNYDVHGWQLLIDALNDTQRMKRINVINRAQIIDDALALARSDYISYDLALNVTTYLKHELEYMSWTGAIASMSYLYDRLSNDTDSLGVFEWYTLRLLENVYNNVNGFEVVQDDSQILRLKRTVILSSACRLKQKGCNNDAEKLFGEWKSSSNPDKINPIDPDLKSTVYCAGMRHGNKSDYDYLILRYRNANNVASEQTLILNALGCSTNVTLLEAYLNESIKVPSLIRKQDARKVITAVYNNPIGVDLALNFLLVNWNTTSQLYGGIGSTASVLSGLSLKLNTQQQRNKLQTFLDDQKDYLSPTERTSFENAIQVVNETLLWHTKHRQSVVSWMKKKRGDPQKNSVTMITAKYPIIVFLTVISYFFGKL